MVAGGDPDQVRAAVGVDAGGVRGPAARPAVVGVDGVPLDGRGRVVVSAAVVVSVMAPPSVGPVAGRTRGLSPPPEELAVGAQAGASAVQARRLIRSGSSLVSTRVARAVASSPLARTGA